MYQALVLMSLFGPILVTGRFTCSDDGWLLFGTSCYKIGDSLNHLEATSVCSELGGYIIMPKTTAEMEFAKSLQNIDGTIEQVWIGLKTNNSDGNWKWVDGTAFNKMFELGASPGQNCARFYYDSIVRDIECYNAFKTVCQRDADLAIETTSSIDIMSSPDITTTHNIASEGSTTTEADILKTTSAHVSTNTETSVESSTSYLRLLETSSNIDTTSSQEITNTHTITSESPSLTTETDPLVTTSVQLSTNTDTSVESSTSYIRQSALSTTVSTTKEPVSTIESETRVVPENLSTALKVSSQVSPVSSKTTEHLQMPTQTTKYTDAATAPQTHTQTNRLIPTTISSPNGQSKCTQSSTNSCRCQKRTVANTTENQTLQTLKVTDYIWLNKCAMQPLIDSGMVNVENCPYVCKCSPKGSTTSQEEMFACVRRP